METSEDPIPKASSTEDNNYVPKNTGLTPGRSIGSVSDAIDAASSGGDGEAASSVKSANTASISSHINTICIVCHLRPPFKPKRDGESNQICRHCQSTGALVSNLIFVMYIGSQLNWLHPYVRRSIAVQCSSCCSRIQNTNLVRRHLGEKHAASSPRREQPLSQLLIVVILASGNHPLRKAHHHSLVSALV